MKQYVILSILLLLALPVTSAEFIIQQGTQQSENIDRVSHHEIVICDGFIPSLVDVDVNDLVTFINDKEEPVYLTTDSDVILVGSKEAHTVRGADVLGYVTLQKWDYSLLVE